MSVVRNLVLRIGADMGQMRTEMRRAQQQIKVFGTNIKAAMAGIAASLAAVGIGAAIKEATSDAMKVEAAMQQIGRTMGASAVDFKNWAENSALAFNLSKSEAIRFGSTYSNLISNFSKDTATTMQYTEELLKSSAIVASATGRSMEDVMDRIRSGMLGETDAVEDLGINVNNAMIQSTDAFKKFANGKSWDKLSFQTQQQILYFSILEQATKKYGTTIADNTASRQQQFIAQLKNTQLSLGQAFLPIYNAVLPALTRMAEGLARAMDYVAQFSQALFGRAKATKQIDAQADAVSGLGDAYAEAGKAATKSVAGFDEINSLADASGGGSGTTPPPPKLPDSSELGTDKDVGGGISTKIQEMADNFKKALKDFIPEETKQKLTDSLTRLKDSFKDLGTSISDLVKTIASSPQVQEWFANFKVDTANRIASSIDSISGGLKAWSGTLQLISGLISGDFEKAFNGFEKNISGTYDSLTGFIGIFSPETAEKMKAWKKDFSEAWAGLKDEIKKYGDPTKLEALDFAEYIRDKVSTKFEEMGKSISKTWYAIENGITWGAIKTTVVAYWEEMKAETTKKWDEFKEVLSGGWENTKKYVKWDEIKNTIITSWENLKTDTSRVWDEFKTSLGTKWEEIKAFVNWDSIKDRIITSWTNLITDTGSKWDDLKKKVSEKFDLMAKLDFSGVNTAILAVWGDLTKKTGEIWDGIGTAIKNGINSAIDLVNGFVDKVNSIKINIPSVNIPGIGELGGGSYGMPQIPRIPRLARGGIVDGATNMGNYIAGEAGAEMIVPLENTSFVDKVASALGTAVLTAMQAGNKSNGNQGGSDIIIDGVKLARAIAPYLNKENSRSGGAMITIM